MKRKPDLKKFIDSLDQRKIIFLIHYGSSLKNENYEDVDLVLVQEEIQGKESMKFAGFDIISENMNYFQEKINLRDPAYATEPILTGELLIGDEKEFKKIKKELEEETEADWRYLLQFSIEDYYRAEQFLSQKLLFRALQVLHFSFSYFHFSKWYLENDSLITWKELQKELPSDSNRLLNNMKELLEIAKMNEEELKKKTVNEFFDLYSSKLLLSFDK